GGSRPSRMRAGEPKYPTGSCRRAYLVRLCGVRLAHGLSIAHIERAVDDHPIARQDAFQNLDLTRPTTSEHDLALACESLFDDEHVVARLLGHDRALRQHQRRALGANEFDGHEHAGTQTMLQVAYRGA